MPCMAAMNGMWSIPLSIGSADREESTGISTSNGLDDRKVRR